MNTRPMLRPDFKGFNRLPKEAAEHKWQRENDDRAKHLHRLCSSGLAPAWPSWYRRTHSRYVAGGRSTTPSPPVPAPTAAFSPTGSSGAGGGTAPSEPRSVSRPSSNARILSRAVIAGGGGGNGGGCNGCSPCSCRSLASFCSSCARSCSSTSSTSLLRYSRWCAARLGWAAPSRSASSVDGDFARTDSTEQQPSRARG